MMQWGFWAFPFFAAASILMMLIWLIAVAFWIWMLVDCAQRRFRSNTEKIIWIVVIALGTWLGALVYLIVIKATNPEGLARRQ